MSSPRSTSELTRFLAIMGVAYAAWFLAYDLWLLPDGRLDGWLSERVAGATGALLHTFGAEVLVRGREVWAGEAGIELVAGCNGLSVLSLFVGFVVAYPGRWARRLWFIPLGIAALVATNVVRCAVLLVLLRRSQSAFDVAHGGSGLLVFYAVVFALWVLWARIGGGGERPAAAPGLGLAAA